MQEKLAEFNAALAEKEEGDRDALEQELTELRAANSEQLKSTAEKIHKAATDWAALETATRKQLAAAEAAVAKVQAAAGDTAAQFEARLAAALAALDTKLAALPALVAKPAAPEPAPEPAAIPESKPEPVSVVESVSITEVDQLVASTGTVTEEAKPRKPRAPRKPKEEVSEPELSPAEPNVSDSSAEPAPSSSASDEAAAPAEAAASSDGATRLLATAYIGIGNKLFIRGEGPGLSWDKGVPMQFVSIGKWGWATHDASAPVRCKLYKNDETVAVSGEVVLEPGKHVEVTALF
jgi:chemotaxis protein histidine kinase CheA